EVAAASEAVAVTSGRRAKTALLAACLREADPGEVPIVAGWLTGQPRQRRTGIGWASLREMPPPAEHATLTVLGVDAALDEAAAALAGPQQLAAFRLTVGQPLAPMLAQSAPDLASALERTGPAAVEWKLDGVRVQVHRDGDDVAVFTRTLDDITDRVPEVVEA